MLSIRRLWPMALWVSLTAFAQAAEITQDPIYIDRTSGDHLISGESSTAPAGRTLPATRTPPATVETAPQLPDQGNADVPPGASTAPGTGGSSTGAAAPPPGELASERQPSAQSGSDRAAMPLAPANSANAEDRKSRPPEAVRRPGPGSAPVAARPALTAGSFVPGNAAPGKAASGKAGPEPAADPGPPGFTAPGGRLRSAPIPRAPDSPTGSDSNLPPLRELLLTATDLDQAQQQRQFLAQRRVSISSRKLLSGLGFVLTTYRVPDGLDMAVLVREVQEAFPAASVERNQRHQLLAMDRHRYGQLLVGVATPSTCGAAVTLAMLDSGVNVAVPALAGAEIRTLDVTGSSDVLADHGTAVAALLLSRDPAFPGLLPNGSLVAINVFAPGPDGREETRTDWLLHALDRLAALEPRPLAVNLSFGGDHSALLARVFFGLARELLLVAAAGNAGDDRPVYPAAYAGVHAVGALNASGRRSRQSSYGTHVNLMAPGEDIWVSGADGRGFYASGTSFAAPFATAALALARSAGISAADYLDSLGDSRRVNLAGLCRQP